MKARHLENYGVIKSVREEAASMLADRIFEVRSRVGLLEFGHNRFQHIDTILKKEMGRNVKEYWVAQSQVYKSMIRRDIWERALAIVKERAAGTKASRLKTRPRQSTSLESFLRRAEERS